MDRSKTKIEIIIVGAGKAGELILKDIKRDKESPFHVMGFVDDDKKKWGKTFQGIKILGAINDLNRIVQAYGIQEVFIAIPSERGKVIREIVEATIGQKLVYKILPRLPEVLMQDFNEDYLKYLRKVRADDLLGGEILKADQQAITEFTISQTVMITGAAGSIGAELARQIAAHSAKKIIMYDWWENGMFELANDLLEINTKAKLEFVIGDIRDRRKLESTIKRFRPTTVFHAAAYKHVPLMEHNPSEAVKNNIIGTKTVAEASLKYGVKKFILVSTDKAVNPVNIMGATKRAAEKIIHILSLGQTKTIFCAVRFGNVINSNGSAIPVFERQIEKGGPVTVTHREITRFFMTIPEAVHLILQSWVMGKNNDLFVLDMGESIKIYDLARLLIALQGYEPEKDIKLKVVGLRPGEKLFEEVLVKEEETKATSVKKIFRTKNYMSFDKQAFVENLDDLINSVEENAVNHSSIKSRLQLMVSTYKPSKPSGKP